jgi:hypothetical protein
MAVFCISFYYYYYYHHHHYHGSVYLLLFSWVCLLITFRPFIHRALRVSHIFHAFAVHCVYF